jgi:hypothetical protein
MLLLVVMAYRSFARFWQRVSNSEQTMSDIPDLSGATEDFDTQPTDIGTGIPDTLYETGASPPAVGDGAWRPR